MPDHQPGITVVTTDPLDIPTFDAGDHTPTSLWHALIDTPEIQARILTAFREFARGRTSTELHEALQDRDIPYWLQPGIEDIARGNKRTAIDVTTTLLPRFGTGQYSLDGLHATLSLLEALDDTDADTHRPAIAVKLTDTFKERDRSQREAILQILVQLSSAVDVRLVASRVTRAWLAATHRTDLPGVNDWKPTRQRSSTVDATVDKALTDLDPDSRTVTILEQLAADPAETLSYDALDAKHCVTRDRIRQIISELAALQLVDPFGPQSDRHVELLTAGRRVLTALREEYGQQATLTEAVSGYENPDEQAVSPAQAREGGDPTQTAAAGGPNTPDPIDASGNEGVGPYRTRYADRGHAAAAYAIGEPHQVTILEEDSAVMEATRDGRTKYVDVDCHRDQALVSVRATGCFQYVTSIATALASPQFIEAVFTNERLEAIEQPPAILRAARCIGELSTKALNDPATLRESFVDWGNEIQTMTGEMQREEYEDRDRFRGEILRSAHGLAGSIVHLLDVVGFTLVRDIRVPNDLDEQHRASLAKSIGISASIQSRYGEFAAYRQLFETDAGPPEFSPKVDAADPVGNCIGGFVIRGNGDRFAALADELTARFRRPGDPRENPADFVVQVPIRHAGRREYGAAIARVLNLKNLQPDRELVSLLYTISPHPFAVSQALLRGLETEAVPETFRPDEARRALQTLEPVHVFPELPRSVATLMLALLRADTRLPTDEVARVASVSTVTARKYLPVLASVGLVDEGPGGWRFQVSWPTTEERRDWVVPSHLEAAFQDVAGDLLAALLPPARYADPDDPVAGMLFGLPDPWPVIDSGHRAAPWVAVAGRVAGLERDDAGGGAMVAMGPAVEQTPLPGTASSG